MTHALVADGVSVKFGDTLAVDNVCFGIEPATSAAIIGPNGSGKTTILNLLVGLVKPTIGTVTIGGLNETAYVLQHRNSSRWMPLTAGEVVAMGTYRRLGLWGRLTGSDRAVIHQCAERLEVDSILGRQFDELSGGQRQRVLLAQALVQQPKVLLMDEPITGLDLASQQRILGLIDTEVKRGVTVIITTHNLDEARHCDKVLLVNKRLVACGRPDEVLHPDRLREAYGPRLLGDHSDHDHGNELLLVDDPAHGHDHDHDH